MKTPLRTVPKDTKGPSGPVHRVTRRLLDFAGGDSEVEEICEDSGLGEDVSAGVVANNPSARMPSPAAEAAIKLKEARYRTLLNLADGQLKY